MCCPDLSGKVAIVTGGNQGIGLAIGEGLSGQGAHVVIANRRSEQGEAAARQLLDKGLSAEHITIDVSSAESVAYLTRSVL